MRVDLVTKQEKLAIAEKKAAELRKRLEIATARLDAQKKEKKGQAEVRGQGKTCEQEESKFQTQTASADRYGSDARKP